MSSITKLDNGRYEIRYRDPIGRPRRRRFDTQKAAKDHLATVRTKGQRLSARFSEGMRTAIYRKQRAVGPMKFT